MVCHVLVLYKANGKQEKKFPQTRYDITKTTAEIFNKIARGTVGQLVSGNLEFRGGTWCLGLVKKERPNLSQSCRSII